MSFLILAFQIDWPFSPPLLPQYGCWPKIMRLLLLHYHFPLGFDGLVLVYQEFDFFLWYWDSSHYRDSPFLCRRLTGEAFVCFSWEETISWSPWSIFFISAFTRQKIDVFFRKLKYLLFFIFLTFHLLTNNSYYRSLYFNNYLLAILSRRSSPIAVLRNLYQANDLVGLYLFLMLVKLHVEAV